MTSSRGRAGTGPWSRLRPVNLDPLEEMGLPSKGDKRLLDFKQQERYYTKIVERYMTFCSTSGDSLLSRLSSLSVQDIPSQTQSQPEPKPRPPPSSTTPSGSIISIESDSSQKDVSVLLMSMRKLREAIVASHRHDSFSTSAYIFIIRLSILMAHWASYLPALLHLLYRLHPSSPLHSSELQEIASYLVVDLACRQNDLAAAHAVRVRFSVRKREVAAILKSLVDDDWELWWRTRKQVDGHLGALMEWAERGVKERALKAMGRAYLGVDLVYLEKVTGTKWEVLVKEFGVGWELGESGKVVIRRPKAKAGVS